MKNLRHFSHLLFAALLTLIAFVCASCGGDGTASPTLSGGNPIPQISVQIISPNPSTTTLGGSLQFSAIVHGTSNQAVTWSLTTPTGAPDATISDTGLFQTTNQQAIKVGGTNFKPAQATNFVYTVHAQSVADPSKTASASATVTPPISVHVTTPDPNTTNLGGTLQFTALVTGTSNTAVTWSVTGQAGAPTATVSNTGVFSTQSNQQLVLRNATSGTLKPAGDTVQTWTYTVKATSVADPTKFDTGVAIVSVNNSTVTVTPQTNNLTGGESTQYHAVVTGTSNQTVTWSVSGNFTISSSGLLTTSPNGPFGNFTVTARSTVTGAVGTATGSVNGVD